MQHNFWMQHTVMKEAEGVLVGALSGLMTGIAAGADVFGLVNLDDRPLAVSQIRIRWATTTAFAAAQAMAFRVNKVTGFTTIHSSGGTAVQAHHRYQEGILGTATGDRIALTSLSAYIAGTAAITGATYTAEDTDEPDVFAIGAGSTLPGVYEDCSDPSGLPLFVLPKNTGLIVNNHIAMGSSGVGNLFVGIDGFRIG